MPHLTNEELIALNRHAPVDCMLRHLIKRYRRVLDVESGDWIDNEIALLDLWYGVDRLTLRVAKITPCPGCDGTGLHPDVPDHACGECDGKEPAKSTHTRWGEVTLIHASGMNHASMEDIFDYSCWLEEEDGEFSRLVNYENEEEWRRLGLQRDLRCRRALQSVVDRLPPLWEQKARQNGVCVTLSFDLLDEIENCLTL